MGYVSVIGKYERYAAPSYRYGLKLIWFCLTSLLCPAVLDAQQIRKQPNTSPLESMSEEFTATTSLQDWKQFHTTEGYESKIKRMDVANGILQLQPFASGWYADYQAPFLFKTVEGDFDVEVKIKVSGLTDSLPKSEWSLAGLMVREAKKTTVADWQPRTENWLFLTTGIAQPKVSPVFEVKTTNNSVSNLKLRPAKAGWVYLRVVRVQASFILMYRYENETWTVLERFYRPLLPESLQVGLNAYSGWNDVPREIQQDAAIFNKTVLPDVATDMLVQVDYVHFRRPKINGEKLKEIGQPGFRAPFYSPGNLLSDYSVSNEQVLAIIGNSITK